MRYTRKRIAPRFNGRYSYHVSELTEESVYPSEKRGTKMLHPDRNESQLSSFSLEKSILIS